MKRSHIAPALALSAMLTACGGGGGGSKAVVGSPTSTASPSPTSSSTSVACNGTATTPTQLSVFNITQADAPTSVPYTTSYANTSYAFQLLCGGSVQRFELRPGDVGYSGDVGLGKQRSEIMGTNPGYTSPYLFSQPIWLSYAFRIVSTNPIVGWHVVGQLHDHPNAGSIGYSPPFAFTLAPPTSTQAANSAQFQVTTRSSSATTITSNPAPVIQWSTSIVPGQWHQIVAHVTPGFNGNAALQLWFDGAQVFNQSGLNIGYNDVLGFAYWQYGDYREEDSTATEAATNIDVFEYANMEQSTTSLQSRVASPLGIPTVN